MKNKRYLIYIILGVLAVGLGCSLFTCRDWFRKGNQNDYDSITWCTLTFQDSISVIESSAYQKMTIDLPVGLDTTQADAGTKAAVAWIRQELISCSYPNWTTGSTIDSQRLPAFTLAQDDAERFMQACARQGLDSMVTELKAGAEDGLFCSYFNELSIELEYQTDKYLTLTEGYDVYTGGAHGSYMVDGATFRRSDGKRMGWNLFDMSKKEEIRKLLVLGVLSYFQGNNDDGEKITEEELYQEYLLLFDDPDTPQNELEEGLPFPGTEPYVTAEGIVIVYQQYEIAAYAYGLPSFVLPIKKVTSLLSEEGKALLTTP